LQSEWESGKLKAHKVSATTTRKREVRYAVVGCWGNEALEKTCVVEYSI